jgi:hypothetical protein
LIIDWAIGCVIAILARYFPLFFRQMGQRREAISNILPDQTRPADASMFSIQFGSFSSRDPHGKDRWRSFLSALPLESHDTSHATIKRVFAAAPIAGDMMVMSAPL